MEATYHHETTTRCDDANFLYILYRCVSRLIADRNKKKKSYVIPQNSWKSD
jgi:hypothetical protein